jgi:hypothetical protein
MKLTGNTKTKLTISIDIVLFILLVSTVGIGFLMKFVLVPGQVRNEIYGNNVNLEFLGLTRHEWGSIHLIISIIFLSLLILHIIFHWKLIVSFFKCMFPADEKLVRLRKRYSFTMTDVRKSISDYKKHNN